MSQTLSLPAPAKTQSRVSNADRELKRYVEGRLMGLRVNRYSWWCHWREIADYLLPRRYKWIITPNQMARGAPINQHILDSTGTLAARDLSAGLLSGKCSPLSPWLKLKIGRMDSTQTSPVSLWLAECERLMYLVFAESGFYNAMAQFFTDLVIFGTSALLMYEEFENVVQWINPCLGEFYVDIDGKYRPVIFYREFTMTISAVVDEFGLENCSDNIQRLYREPNGANLTREIIVAHAIEPNDDGRASKYGIPSRFKFRECYWEWGGSASPQNGSAESRGFLRKRGFMEQPMAIGRWDLVSNDPYGRSPGMDALPDVKQLQLETRRKAQGIDKMVNPPLVADIQLKNQPASLLPGAITYVSGYSASGKPGFASVYDTKFPVNEMKEDLMEVRQRVQTTFFAPLFKTISQYVTRSNVTAQEIAERKNESMIMLGPVLERIDVEVLKPIVERVFAMMSRAGILPPAPPEVQGMAMNIEFVSMLQRSQDAAQATGIERLFGLTGNLVGIDPSVMDNIDIDMAIDIYSHLMNNSPKIIRSPEDLQRIRADRQAQQQAQQKAAMAEQLAKGAKNMADIQTGEGRTALMDVMGQA